MVVKHSFNECDIAILKELINNDTTTLNKAFRNNKNGTYVTFRLALKRLVSKGIIKRKLNPDNKTEYLLSYDYNKLDIKDLIELLK
jgi:predicted transcriptional regulator